MLKTALTAIIITAAVAANAATPSLLTKAERFYSQEDWASAAAMYSLLIDENPDSTGYYARAITAQGMRNDTTAQMQLMRMALIVPMKRATRESTY